MVLCDLVNAARADPVATAVTDMGYHCGVISKCYNCQGSAHIILSRISLRLLIDANICQLNSV